MNVELCPKPTGRLYEKWAEFLKKAELTPDEGVESTVFVWDGETIAATGSRQGNVLKCIAVDDAYQGEGLTATLLTQLRQDALSHGQSHLFLYTKPKNAAMFSSLFFYPVAQTDNVLLMENKRGGVQNFLQNLPTEEGEPAGAIVMHCNPFTKGHRYLIETAAKRCGRLYLFILSEEGGLFPAADRLDLVKQGTADLPNVTVLPSGPYLISAATFPTYFLKDKTKLETVQCKLDAAVFGKHFAPRFGITRRFVGTEPLCPVTSAYNEALKSTLPTYGIEVTEVPRLETEGTPVSASAVRALLGQGKGEELKKLVPETTYRYLEMRNLI